jgi:hypothetical protein
MPDDKTPPGPFRVISDRVPEPPALMPRVGPTMVEIKNALERILDLAERGLKRQQQTALMVDGFSSTVNRRLDVLHEEAALTRAGLQLPREEADNIPISLERPATRSPKDKARHAAVLTGKLLSYGTTLAIVLRIVGKNFPEYQEAIDAVLGLLGL